MTTNEKMAEIILGISQQGVHYSPTLNGFAYGVSSEYSRDGIDGILQAYEAEKTLLAKTQEHHDHGMVEDNEFVRVRRERLRFDLSAMAEMLGRGEDWIEKEYRHLQGTPDA